ncbi:MAG: hypothetical protein KC777_24235 [Cyanobacteria bacterium HKST-UBA02]|nr:hypothetical protein [Cyanobacteria bacterium HKST-UBA02]
MFPSVYITGDSVNARDYVGDLRERDWRALALTKLQKSGLKVINPLELAWSFRECESGLGTDSADKRVRRALELIDQCDALLANLEESSYATAMEIFYAHRHGKMVTVVGPSPFSPWVLTHSQARFRDIDRAIDYIIEEHPRTAPLSWALQYEAQLSERYEQMPPCGEPDYKFIGGELPVLVVAPHATAYWREGEFYEQDSFTGSMASVANRMSGCHSLLSYYCCVADPCWYLDTPFRRALTDFVKTGKVGLTVLLLGSNWHEAPGLQVSYYGKKAGRVYHKLLKEKLSRLEPVDSSRFDEPVRPLIRFLDEELSTPTIVVHMHKRYRMPRLQPNLFSMVSSLLSEFVFEAGKELERSRH